MLLCAAVGMDEVRLRHERMLFGNLGVDALNLGELLLTTPLARELLIRSLMALLG